MESRDNSSSKRKKDKHDEDASSRDRRHKRPRSKSRSPKARDRDSRRKRRHSYSRSPDRPVKQEKGNDSTTNPEPKKDIPERKPKETDMLNTRTGGAYIPPARLRMMQAQITDKASVAYQRLAWEALKKSIHGHINKINVGNIGIIIKELLKENIVRGRGLLCRSIIQAQAASPTFTNVYAALVSAVNSRFPNIGELLLKRLVIQFKRGFKRNDKPTCISSASFIAHLVNQRVAHEILALELLTLLVETPTDDSVEVAIAFLKECGQKLTEVSSKGVNAIFEMLRNILHEGQLDKRVQYMIEVMFQVWKDGFKDHPALIEELELVPEEEQFTHLLMLDDATDPQDILNVFKFDEKYEENEQKYKNLSNEILGSDAESGEEVGSDGSGSEESDDEEHEEQKPVTIIDNTETNLVALRRTIYLTINSSLDFEECAHKLMKMQLKPGQEVELCHMFLDCCAEQRTYEKFYGLLAQRFCNINRIYIGPFEDIFKDSYGTAHRLDTNRLRNVSKFFAHLLFTDSISWEVLECVKLNEEDTTSSSRIYIKILFQELAEYMGLKKLNDRLKDQTLQGAFSGIFPRDNPKNTRFSINFFTSIGLGGLTDELREHLKQMPKNLPTPVQEINVDSESSSSSSSSSSDDSSSSGDDSSDSDAEKGKKKKNKDKNKEKAPKTPELTTTGNNKNDDRWGHDGFYDQYGKDARRTDNRADNQERDNDNFARSRDMPVRNERDRNRPRDRDYENREGGDRRRYNERNDDESSNRRRNNDNRGDRKKHNERNVDEGGDRRRHGDEGGDRRRNNERNGDERGDRKRNGDERDDRKRNDDESGARSRNNEGNNDERGERRRNNDEGGDRRRNNERGDRPINTERNDDEGGDRRRNNEKKDESSRDSRKIQNRDDRNDPKRDQDPDPRHNENQNRSRDKENSSSRKKDDRSGSDQRNTEQRKEDRCDKNSEKDNRNKRQDTIEGEERLKSKTNKESRKERQGNEVGYSENSSRIKSSREENRKEKSRNDESSDDEKSKNRHEKYKRDKSDYSSSKVDKNKKYTHEDSSEKEDPRSKKPDRSEKSKTDRREYADNKANRSEGSDYEQARDQKKIRDKKEKRRRDSSEEGYKHKRDERKCKENDGEYIKFRSYYGTSGRKDKESARDNDDGWDIRRGSSVRKELGDRYWK